MFKKIGRNDLCWCGSHKKYKNCHGEFDNKIELYKLQGHLVPSREMIKTQDQISGIRESGKINIAVLDTIEKYIKEGITTDDIDKLVYQKKPKN